MSVAGGQQRTFLSLLAQLRPHWRTDRALPARIQSLLRTNRSFGSRDRRLYRELVYTALRYLPWIEPLLQTRPDDAVAVVAWLATDSRSTAHFREHTVAGWPPCPRNAVEKWIVLRERGLVESADSDPRGATVALLPEWFLQECPEAMMPEQLDALLSRAPVWLRLRPDKQSEVLREFADRSWRTTPSEVLETAYRLIDDVDATKSDAFQQGWFEVQDLGSQLILAAAGASPEGRWLDACAGAGGKTLQLATLLQPQSTIDAFDIRPDALQELASRAARAGVPLIDARRDAAAAWRSTPTPNGFATVRLLGALTEETYDSVLVDAPCSGSGTWRRAPHLKWATQPSHVANAAARQQRVLDQASRRVAPGARLIYATCSLCRRENEQTVADFLASHHDFEVEAPPHSFGGREGKNGLTFLPALHDTDGFFVATLRRTR